MIILICALINLVNILYAKNIFSETKNIVNPISNVGEPVIDIRKLLVYGPLSIWTDFPRSYTVGFLKSKKPPVLKLSKYWEYALTNEKFYWSTTTPALVNGINVLADVKKDDVFFMMSYSLSWWISQCTEYVSDMIILIGKEKSIEVINLMTDKYTNLIENSFSKNFTDSDLFQKFKAKPGDIFMLYSMSNIRLNREEYLRPLNFKFERIIDFTAWYNLRDKNIILFVDNTKAKTFSVSDFGTSISDIFRSYVGNHYGDSNLDFELVYIKDFNIYLKENVNISNANDLLSKLPSPDIADVIYITKLDNNKSISSVYEPDKIEVPHTNNDVHYDYKYILSLLQRRTENDITPSFIKTCLSDNCKNIINIRDKLLKDSESLNSYRIINVYKDKIINIKYDIGRIKPSPYMIIGATMNWNISDDINKLILWNVPKFDLKYASLCPNIYYIKNNKYYTLSNKSLTSIPIQSRNNLYRNPVYDWPYVEKGDVFLFIWE